MTPGHLEVERKYDVDTLFALPELTGQGGVVAADGPVEHHLEAVYYDTPDLRLIRARVTLRRRTGGPDAGWHLKLPAGVARREVHAPLGPAAGDPPRALLEPVTGILRGASARPVATLRTRRLVTELRDADGRVVAEVAEDMVTAAAPAEGSNQPAEVHTWREVEVELVDGDEDVLEAVEKALTAAGARPSASASKLGRVLAERLAADSAPPAPARAMKRKRKRTGRTAGEFLVAAIGEQVAALQAADLLLRTDQPDAVHQLRVAARRLRSSLAAFRDVLDRGATRQLREELSWLGDQLSGVRDDEVALAHLRALVAAEPVELVPGPVAARIQQTQLREARAGLDRALVTVSEQRYLRLLDSLHDLLAAPPYGGRAGDPVKPVVRDAVRRSVRRLRRRLAAARRAPDAERAVALHAVRTAAKRVRYAAEVARGEIRGAKPLVRTARRVQAVLGELQDSVVTREHCRRLGMVAFAAGENSFAYGRLHGLEQARAERAEREFWILEPEIRPVLRGATH
jgi:CHAD domain-containing protein